MTAVFRHGFFIYFFYFLKEKVVIPIFQKSHLIYVR